MQRQQTASSLAAPLFILALLLLLSLAPGILLAQDQKPAPTRTTAWMIELQEPPTAVVYAAEQPDLMASAATAAAQAQLAKIDAAQQALSQQLVALDAPPLFSVQRVYNGMAVLADAEQRQAIAQLPGVTAVHPLIPKLPHNATSIPYLGLPAVWQTGARSGAQGGLRGEGIRVAVIDTGIDYLHRDFAGPGNGYAQNDPAVIDDAQGYPGPRIVGGYDFVGDDYNASAGQPGYQPIPRPDPDPMDCQGHGTHVAGTLAGSGVTAGGATFTGPYDQRVDFTSLVIGPGVAPRADVYALKIFGCAGSTNVTDLALEWAVDPNRDGDFADRMDVVNLSLGSPYGAAYDTSAVAANNAALVGVIVVASAGNSGDTQLIAGAPSIAGRAISVAASEHTNDSIAYFSARGPRRGDAALKPDLAAPGVSIYSASSGTGWLGISASGTSMAAPHVAGVMALLRQAHPDWSVEELKALAMNTAAPVVRPGFVTTATLETPVRSGVGRINPPAAIAANVIAYAADGSSQVSISFGAPAVSAVYTATQQLAVTNKSAEDVWLAITYESLAKLPGAEVRTEPRPLRVPAHSTVRTPVTLIIKAAQLQRLRAPADAALSAEAWFAEESGFVALRRSSPPSGPATIGATQPALRVPVYVAPRPLATMDAATSVLDFSNELEQTIELAGASLVGSAPPTDVVALASVLELRLRSPNVRPQGLEPNIADTFDHADLKYVGVTAHETDSAGADEANIEDATIYFGVTTWAPRSTPNEISVSVLIDTNRDGVDDFRLFNFDVNSYGGFWFGPAYTAKLLNLQTFESWAQDPLNGISPNRYDSGLFFGNALILPVNAGDLGLTAKQSSLAFRIETTSIDLVAGEVKVIDRTPTLYFDVQQPALHFTLQEDTAPLWRDAPENRIQVRLDPAGQARAPAAGVLILHHHNAANAQASLVAVNYRWPVSIYLPVIQR